MHTLTFKERLLRFLKHLNIGQGAFEANCHLGNGSVNKIKMGMSSESLVKIRNRYPELNLLWLINEEGEMLETKTSSASAGDVTKSNKEEPISSETADAVQMLILEELHVARRFQEWLAREVHKIPAKKIVDTLDSIRSSYEESLT